MEQTHLGLGNYSVLLKPTEVQITLKMFHGVAENIHTPRRQRSAKWKHSFFLFFSFLLKHRLSGLYHYLCQSLQYFPWLRDMHKAAVTNANFVVRPIYISKLLTFQSITSRMSSGLCFPLDYLLEFILLQTGRPTHLSLTTGLKVSKWFIDSGF